MKQLKSNLADLKEIFENSITVKYIAEPMASFDSESPAKRVREFMDNNKFDVIGVRKDGHLCGYAEIAKMGNPVSGILEDYLEPFKPASLIGDTDSLLKAFEIVGKYNRAFIRVCKKVCGIVTRGDLHKAPVRMWLFGLITLIEMQMLRIIHDNIPKEEWEKILSEGRLQKAKKEYKKLSKGNEEICLVDCLQFCDKRKILNNKEIQRKINLEIEDFENSLEELEKLRNNLAHGQDVISLIEPDIFTLADKAKNILEKLEKVKWRL